MNLNKAFILGRMVRQPELRSLPAGGSATSFSVASNSSYKAKDGTRQEKVEYHNIVTFGSQAESCAKYLTQGQEVFIEGRIQTRSWEKEGGEKMYKTEIVADRVQFGAKALNAPRQGEEPVIDQDNREEHKPQPKPKQTAKKEVKIEYPTEDINPEDIPF